MAPNLKKIVDQIDLIFQVHTLRAYVHMCARYEVSRIKSVLTENNGYTNDITDDDNTRGKIHDCTGPLAFLSNEPKSIININLVIANLSSAFQNIPGARHFIDKTFAQNSSQNT